MLEFLAEYALFLAEVLTIAGAVIVVIVIAAGLRQRPPGERGVLEIRKLNDQLDGMRDALRRAVMPEAGYKKLVKDEKKAQKREEKSKGDAGEPRVFVLDFDGDIDAHAVENLRREISAVLTTAGEGDEVVLRLESPGGTVHGYGLAAAQLQRLRDADVALTVCVDRVAASGGYLMACLANRIIAAPFAIIGSIGVIAQLPNFHRLLKKNAIDFELHTAGDYKRTLTMFGENTEAGRQKFREELGEAHDLFKSHVASHRDVVDIEANATGEIWYGQQAIERKLIDEIGTSDGYLSARAAEHDVFEVTWREQKTPMERLSERLATALADTVVNRLFERLRREERPF